MRSWSGANIAPKIDITTSKLPSSKGRFWASASTNSTSSRSAAARSRPRSSSAGTKSLPTVPTQVRRAAAIAPLPLPQATSRTRSSGSDVERLGEVFGDAVDHRGDHREKSPSDQVRCCAAVTAVEVGGVGHRPLS